MFHNQTVFFHGISRIQDCIPALCLLVLYCRCRPRRRGMICVWMFASPIEPRFLLGHDAWTYWVTVCSSSLNLNSRTLQLALRRRHLPSADVMKKCVDSCSIPWMTLNDCTRWQNELGILEFIHNLVETLDKYFESVVSQLSPLPHPPHTHTHTHTHTHKSYWSLYLSTLALAWLMLPSTTNAMQLWHQQHFTVRPDYADIIDEMATVWTRCTFCYRY